MNSMKSFLFENLKKLASFFGSLGINKNTPGVLPVYDFFFKKFWPYPEVVEIQGSKMCINLKEESYNMRKTLEAYANNLIHEKATTDLFSKVVKEGNTVVDLGANIGYFTLLASRIVGQNGRVYAFEPEPKNFSYLKKNIELNGYTQAIPLEKAASDKAGKTKLFICHYDTGHHTINQSGGIDAYRPEAKNENKESVDIETISLDEFFRGKEDSIDVIKMDVEGAEFLALSGMDNILIKNRKLKMFVEFFPLLIKQMGSSPEEFIKKLFFHYQFSAFVIPEDYDAGKDGMLKIESFQELMKLCSGEKDHVNLFLSHNGK